MINNYNEKIKWLEKYLPFLKIDFDIIAKNIKSSKDMITLDGTNNADLNIYLSNPMCDAILGKNTSYNVILSINVFNNIQNKDEVMYSISLISAEENFITHAISQYVDKMEIELDENMIKFSQKEFVMIKNEFHQSYIEKALNKMILLFTYASYYVEHNNFFDETVENDITLISMVDI